MPPTLKLLKALEDQGLLADGVQVGVREDGIILVGNPDGTQFIVSEDGKITELK